MKYRKLNRQKYLTDEEFVKLDCRMRTIAADGGSSKRDAVIILLAMYTGARASEILNLREIDIEPASRTLHFRGLKGSNDREIPIPEWLWEYVVWFAAGKGRGLIFDISYKRLFQVWHSLRTCNKKFHALRHTFAVRHLRRTNNLRLIQIALGHASINSTMVYASYLMETDELKKLLGVDDAVPVA